MTLRKDIEENKQEHKEENELCNAINDDDTNRVRDLLNKKNININFINENGDAPVHLAVKKDNAEILALLLDEKANLNLRNGQGEIMSRLIFRLNSWKCMETYLYRFKKFMIPGEINPDPVFVNSFIKAVLEERYSLVNLLNQKIEKPKLYNLVDQEGNTALHHAVQKNLIKMVKLLLKCQADTSIKNKQNRNALDLACYLNRGNCAIELINNNAICTRSALLSAIQHQNQEITSRILKSNNHPDLYKYDIEQGNIYIYEAIKNDNIAILKLLLNKINLSKVNKTQDGKTPYMIAESLGKNKCYNFLKRLRDQKEFLEKMKKEIVETEWKRKMGIFWVNDAPHHIKLIKDKLEKDYENETDVEKTFRSIYDIFNNLNVSLDENRHPTTITFDQNSKIKMTRILQKNNNLFSDYKEFNNETSYNQTILSQQASAPFFTNSMWTNNTSTNNYTYVPCQTNVLYDTQSFLLNTDKGYFLLQTNEPDTQNFLNLINNTIGFTPLNDDDLSYSLNVNNFPLITPPSTSSSTPFDEASYTKTNNIPSTLKTSQIFSHSPAPMTFFPRATSTNSNLPSNRVKEDMVPQFYF